MEMEVDVESVELIKENRVDKKRETRSVNFYINGKQHRIRNPDPRLLLIDYLRDTQTALTGTKHACGQGGCGACTVMLSYFDTSQKKVINVSANSCLRPVVALDGMEITTVEGLGSVNSEVSKVQYAIAKNNGSQCGYCTPGFVMNMHALLVEKNGEHLTQRQIEQSFDGNICRCTGYRPILHAMKSFASDWTAADEAGTPACEVDPAEQVKYYECPRTVNGGNLDKAPRSLHYENNGYQWYRVLTIDQAHQLMEMNKDREIKLVAGNTSVGIPTLIPTDPKIMIDISQVDELRQKSVSESEIVVGALTTYNEFLSLLDELIPKASQSALQGLNSLHYMTIRTAGKIVRNVATLAGNTMLVARNVTRGYPFPSDLYVALAALGAAVEVALPGRKEMLGIETFVENYNSNEVYQRSAIIVSYHIPITPPDNYAQSYKVALRKENSHALANAGFKVSLDNNKLICNARLFIGGITTYPFRAEQTEAYLNGKPCNASTLAGALDTIRQEVEGIQQDLPQWFVDLPTEGVSNTYRSRLVQSYVYKFFVSLLSQIDPETVPPKDISAPLNEFDRPVSKGQQRYSRYPDEYPVNQPFIKLSAFEQATGEAVYTHDIPVPVHGLQGAFVTSRRAHADFAYQIPGGDGSFQQCTVEQVERYIANTYPGIVRYFTYRDIPAGGSNGVVKDSIQDPLFCEATVTTFGQCIGLLVGENEQEVVEAAQHLSEHCVLYMNVKEPILGIREAVDQGSIFKGYNLRTDDNQCITKPGSVLDWAIKTGANGLASGLQYGETSLDNQPCVIVAGTQETGCQIHFYMETQSTLAQQGEHHQINVRSSSQSPASVQPDVANTLAIKANLVNVSMKRLGGGYGGKTTRTPYVASPTALASAILNKPVRVAMPRIEDSYMIGHRHPFMGEYNIAIVAEGEDKGIIAGSVAEFYSNGGNTQDCSFDVMDCAILGSDNAYKMKNFQTKGYVCQTNQTSNGAMRSYGGVQAGLIMEEAIEAAAHKIGMLPEEVREKNLYSRGDTTPYGQSLDYCIMKEVWSYLKKSAEFDRQRAEVEAFNAKNTWKKRGISMIPLKYGLGYNLGFLMQGGALIDIYSTDGSVQVSHNGVEMGQGIMTKMAQIAAESLNIPLSLIQMTATRTSVIPNPQSTGATSGSDLNGGAVQQACETQRQRLETLCLTLLQEKGSQWCEQNGINFWDYPDKGWKTETVKGLGGPLMWNNIVGLAYQNRVKLSSQALYSTPGLMDANDQQFYGYTYSACCSTVEIDVLTGESNILRTDMVYDMGKSLNPAIDIGQVEGAFIMGVGNVLCEKVVWEPKGTKNPAGALNTPNTWTYKPPCASTIPIDFRVDLYPREDAAHIPENPNLLMSSKGVGEPPLVLANTVFFAIKHAVLAARQDRGHHEWFEMSSPATVEEIRDKCLVDTADLTLSIT